MDRADKVSDSRLEIHYRLSLTSEMIMDIMAFFGIFHNFLRCLFALFLRDFSPPLAQSPFSVLAWKQQCLKEMPTITLLRVLLYAGSFHLIPSIKRSNKRRSLEMSSNTPSIWAFFEEILSPSKRSFPCSVISRLSSLLLFFTVWQKVTANVSNDSQVFKSSFPPRDDPFKGCFTMSDVLESLVNRWGGQK